MIGPLSKHLLRRVPLVLSQEVYLTMVRHLPPFQVPADHQHNSSLTQHHVLVKLSVAL